ncbi:glutathione S-transferase family protein [Psychrobacter sp. Sarcosine-3u-12]|uniref:glutathione S-transferase family protein n=1 Tax=Psychrobacter sp. Sarcosine-3u-12 TaxID=2058325 RepID=UPI000C33E0DE|nr:glutathione S-transferase family protein [Psychrobacter sp. Sarcosine-3u-12]PKG35979.1 glutathione-dependent reductase [Psychrobacter sp. Sarcosine-3u-12]
MGLLVDGQWQDQWYDTKASGGRFQREDARFRNWITADGRAGPSAVGGFEAEPDRYHLYVSLACPWAHRTTIYRKLKGLEDMISLSVVHPFMGEEGWTFAEGEGVIADPLNNATHAYEIYVAAKSDYTGRVTVPILWDKKTKTIVSNESSEIIRMLNSAFDEVGALAGNFLPSELLAEIDEINAFVYSTVNNGVYKSGFASTQEAYEEAVTELFAALDTLEARLANQRYLVGSTITEADWRLFTTLIRFDAVYVGHFKCNLRRIVDYPNLWGYLRDLYQVPGIAETVNMTHIKQHYYTSHANINPTGIVPVGPITDFNAPHNREQLS